MKNKKQDLSLNIPCQISPTPPMLIGEISHLHRAVMRGAESDGIMSQNGTRLVMRALAWQDGITQKEIAKITHLTPPSVSVIIDKMEEEGYVSRTPDETDRRAVRVYLTDKGHNTHEEKITRLKAIDEMMMRGIEAGDAARLEELLKIMRDNLLAELHY